MAQTTTVEPVVRRVESVPSNPVVAGTATAVQVLLGPAEGAQNFALRKFSMGRAAACRCTPTRSSTNSTCSPDGAGDGGRARARGRRRARALHSGRGAALLPGGRGPFEFLCIVPNAPDRIELVGPGC